MPYCGVLHRTVSPSCKASLEAINDLVLPLLTLPFLVSQYSSGWLKRCLYVDRAKLRSPFASRLMQHHAVDGQLRQSLLPCWHLRLVFRLLLRCRCVCSRSDQRWALLSWAWLPIRVICRSQCIWRWDSVLCQWLVTIPIGLLPSRVSWDWPWIGFAHVYQCRPTLQQNDGELWHGVIGC